MTITYDILYNYTRRNIERALGVREEGERTASMEVEFPGCRHLGLGETKVGRFLTLFLDMRGSTQRALDIGLQKTNATLHALLPTCARIVDDRNGFIVDYPGDGIMAHWDISDDATLKENTIRAVTCIGWIDDAVKNIVNPLLNTHGIPPIVCAQGMSGGRVMITKVGIPGFTSTKAIGGSVNKAAKMTRSDIQPKGGIIIDDAVLNGIYVTLPPGTPEEHVAFTHNPGPDNTRIISPRMAIQIPRNPDESTRRIAKLFE